MGSTTIMDEDKPKYIEQARAENVKERAVAKTRLAEQWKRNAQAKGYSTSIGAVSQPAVAAIPKPAGITREQALAELRRRKAIQ